MNGLPPKNGGTASSVQTVIAGALTGVVVLAFLAHYPREQRHLSTIRRGPRFGGSAAPSPNVFQRTPLDGRRGG